MGASSSPDSTRGAGCSSVHSDIASYISCTAWFLTESRVLGLEQPLVVLVFRLNQHTRCAEVGRVRGQAVHRYLFERQFLCICLCSEMHSSVYHLHIGDEQFSYSFLHTFCLFVVPIQPNCVSVVVYDFVRVQIQLALDH